MQSFNADEVFKIGMEVELNGRAFYQAAVDGCTDDGPKKVLEYLRDEEDKHYASFSKMRDELPEGARHDTVFDPDGEMALYLKALADSRVFTTETEAVEVAKACRTPRDVFQAALRFEKDSVLLFETMKETTKPEWGQDKIGLLIEAEKEHIRKISTAMANLT